MELLLPTVWDPFCVWGMEKDDAPDPDMPKGYVNPATSNNLAAYLTDISSGWRQAPLTLKERRAVLLRYGFDDEQKDIARMEECAPSTMSERLFAAVGKIVAHLNGTDITYYEEATTA